jgi:hypothetical protein
MSTLVLVHLGKALPSYIYDCIFQCLIVNGPTCKILVVMDDSHVDGFHDFICTLDVSMYFGMNISAGALVSAVPVSCLDGYLGNSDHWKEYTNLMSTKFGGQESFRDGFWVSTTARFFYLEAVMGTLGLKSVFHIENDIVMYEAFQSIFNTINDNTKIWMVQDSPNRVVPSILYLPCVSRLRELNEYITNTIRDSPTFVNDMQILGQWDAEKKRLFPINPIESNVVFDGAAIGQYLGGIDTRNLPGQSVAQDKTCLLYTSDAADDM